MKKWIWGGIITLVLITTGILFSSNYFDEKQDELIAKELKVIADAKVGILMLHNRCLGGRSFIIAVNDYQSIGYTCQGAYPLELSFNRYHILTNDATMQSDYPLGLITKKLTDKRWSTKAMKDGRVMIKGPASSHDSGLDGDAIDEKDYWVYDSLDGSLNFYKDGILQEDGPVG